MEAIRIVLICVTGAILSLTIRKQKPEMAFGIAIAAGLVAVFMSLDGLNDAVTVISGLAQGAGIGSSSAQLLIRATGIALIAEFGMQLCKDAGESSLAGRIELGGRVVLLGMAAPLLVDLTGRLIQIIP